MSTKPTEVRAFGSQLLAASKLIGKYCDDVNDEFILCKAEYDNPVHCIKIGRRVTECALSVYVPVNICGVDES
jgi:NADH dehydrogenase (ubiquinone) 1 alpha subcomplex subunit 8